MSLAEKLLTTSPIASTALPGCERERTKASKNLDSQYVTLPLRVNFLWQRLRKDAVPLGQLSLRLERKANTGQAPRECRVLL